MAFWSSQRSRYERDSNSRALWIDTDVSALRAISGLLKRRGLAVDHARSLVEAQVYLQRRRRDDLSLLILEPIIPIITDAQAASSEPGAGAGAGFDPPRSRYLGLCLLQEYPRLVGRTVILTVADPALLLETHPFLGECAGIVRKSRLAYEFMQFEVLLDKILGQGSGRTPLAAGEAEAEVV
jgi:hypothetical protein